MKKLRTQTLSLILPLSVLLSSCDNPQIAYLAINITTEVGSFLLDKFKDGTMTVALENFLDSLFSDVSDTLADETRGAIVENPDDPTGLTGRKAFDTEFVVQRHREAKFKTEVILVKKEDLTFIRASRDSSAKWEMTKTSLNLVTTRLNAAAVQISLKALGIDPGRVDGIWGKRTKDAIGEFQKKQGLPMTREIDKETEKRLLKEEDE